MTESAEQIRQTRLDVIEDFPKAIHQKLIWLIPNPRHEGAVLEISQLYWDHACLILSKLSDGRNWGIPAMDQVILSLQDLIDSKDKAVRAVLARKEEEDKALDEYDLRQEQEGAER